MQRDNQLEKKQNVDQENDLVKNPCNKNKAPCKTLIIHGGKYRTTFTKKFENRPVWTKPDKNKIVSYIPGTVKEMFIREGDIVKKGDNMLVLEAMKMFNTICSPRDAFIKKIYVRSNDKIPKGFIMIEIE